MKRRITIVTAITATIVVVVSCLLMSGWTLADAASAAKHQHRSQDIDANINGNDNGNSNTDGNGTFHDYTEEGVVANGNKMPDGTVANPWDATVGLSGQDRTEAIYEELVARTDPKNSDRPSAALLAELALDAENRTSSKGHTLGVTILDRNQNAAMANRANEAQRDFWHDRDYAIEAFSKLHALWENADAMWIEWVNDYDCSLYMIHDGYLIDGELAPLVVARHSHNAGWHCICFKVRIKDTDEYVVLRYRLECGFQPVNPEYFPIPDTPPVPDNPKPQPDPPGGGDPDIEPKDPDGGPQGQHPDNPDYGGGPNTNNDETITDDPKPEQNSPDEYVAPAPPSEDKPSGGGGNDAPAEKPDASANTDSGSQAVDHENGRQETYKDPDTGKEKSGAVQAGDGGNHGDFAKHADDHPATVEPPADPAPTTDEPSPGNDSCEASE